MNALTDRAAVDPPPSLFPHVKARTGLIGFAWRHPTIVLGAVLLTILVAIALFAGVLGTVDPTAIAPAKRLRPPSFQNWFGTDALGRDLYSRVLYGTRISLAVGIATAVLATVFGMAIGVIASVVRWTDGVIMRIMDGLMSIPPILLAIALMAVAAGSIGNVIFAITVAEVPRVARLVRGVVLSLRDQPYVDAAITVGSSTPKVIWRHILPNTIAPVTVQATFICASAMLIEAALSFIGAGTPPNIPSWGNIMADGRALWQIKPYIIFFPAIFLSVSVLAVNMLGDGLRDALDPRSVTRI